MSAPPHEIEAELERLGQDGYCADPLDLIGDALSLLLPPERISTTECAARYRYIRSKEGRGKRKYAVEMTPYMIGPQDALDDMEHRFVVVVGPGRTGKSVAGENHIFKRLRNGPMTDVIVYLQAGEDINSYADKEFADLFELHPEISARLGPKPSDRKREFKRVSGRTIQLLPANPGNVRQKEATFIWASELDGYRKSVRDGFKDNIATRMQASGNQAKAYIESHPDLGWTGGVAPIWKDSTRGLWYWPCAHCGDFSCPHPLAPKGMHMRLTYDRNDSLGDDGMLDRIEATAALSCPHCGGDLTDEHKAEMLAGGFWVFSGQTIEPDGTVHGEPRRSDAAGFWIHGTMSPLVRFGELARKYVAALVFFEKTRKAERLKEVVVKSLGEVYEGAGAGSNVIKPERLVERHKADVKVEGFKSGTVPAGVEFVTAAIDMGRHKADVKIKGWDLETRSWVIDRYTVTAGPTGRKLDFYNRQEDWLVLRDEVLRKVIPFAHNPKLGLPIAGAALDNSDGNVTHKAREFARQMLLAGESGKGGYRLRLIKGRSSKTAPEVGEGQIVNRDDQGKPIDPPVTEFRLNVDKLKEIAVGRVLIDEDGPGYVRWADDITPDEFTELAGEVQIDGKWDRRGPNESLDLEAYNEMVRIKLGPDRKEINWDVKRPVWARPVRIEPDEPEGVTGSGPTSPRPKPKTMFDRFDALNGAA